MGTMELREFIFIIRCLHGPALRPPELALESDRGGPLPLPSCLRFRLSILSNFVHSCARLFFSFFSFLVFSSFLSFLSFLPARSPRNLARCPPRPAALRLSQECRPGVSHHRGANPTRRTRDQTNKRDRRTDARTNERTNERTINLLVSL